MKEIDGQSNFDRAVPEPSGRREADTDAARKEKGAGQPGRVDVGTAGVHVQKHKTGPHLTPATQARLAGPAPEHEMQSSGR